METIKEKFECQQCGHCCMAVGRDFWLCGQYEDKDEYPWLKELSRILIDKGDGLPCRMLVLINSVAYCQIQMMYGFDAKPEICRRYPDIDEECRECHMQQNDFAGQGICYQVSG